MVKVVALGAGKFYGSSLPRPRFFSEMKKKLKEEEEERVDPPAPVFDPLFLWANEAHWSMGGLSFQRHRLQGRIEGSIKKLRVQQDRSLRMKNAAAAKIQRSGVKADSSEESSEEIAPKKKRARKPMEEFERVSSNSKKMENEEDWRSPAGNKGSTVRRTSPRKLKQ